MGISVGLPNWLGFLLWLHLRLAQGRACGPYGGLAKPPGFLIWLLVTTRVFCPKLAQAGFWALQWACQAGLLSDTRAVENGLFPDMAASETEVFWPKLGPGKPATRP